jgi:hypothetical protein
MSFLRNYMDFTSGSEVPDNYHFWSGIFALSAIVNRQVSLSMGQYTLYPNLYVVLLGPPGNGKSLAMDTAQNLVEDIGGINFSGDAQTKESLVRYLRDVCAKSIDVAGKPQVITPIAMFATELSHLLGPNSGHMIDFLTTIYTKDKQYVTRTKNKGDDIIERPFVGLIACTTQDWITTYLKSDIIGGGFTRRVIFVNEPVGESVDDKSKRRPFLTVSPEQVKARNNVLTYANVLKSATGVFTWHPDAKATYEHWYLTRDIPKDPDVQGYFKTKPNQVLKVAMLISLSESPDLVLRKDHFELSMALFEKTETTLTRVFQGIGRNELNAIANKAYEYILTSPIRAYNAGNGIVGQARMVEQKRLMGVMYRDAPGREVEDIIKHLIATDRVFVYAENLLDPHAKKWLGVKVIT